jgi:hypothetical protein
VLFKKGITKMIEFSLSKLNMLIFVTAIAAIVVFFISAVNSNMKTRQSSELVYKIGKELKTGIENNSYCTVKFLTIPKSIQTNSGGGNAFNMKYKLNISSYTLEDDSKRLVLSIIDTKEKPKLYAADFIDYNGQALLFESDGCGVSTYDSCEIKLGLNNSVNYGPSKVDSIDTQILFAKTIDNGNPTIYLVPCTKKSGIYSCRSFLTTENIFGNIKLQDAIPCLDNIHDLVSFDSTVVTGGPTP